MPTYTSKNTTHCKYNFESKNACTNSNHVLYIFYVRNTNVYLLESSPNFIHDVTPIYHSISIDTGLSIYLGMNHNKYVIPVLLDIVWVTSKKTITMMFGSETVTKTEM